MQQISRLIGIVIELVGDGEKQGIIYDELEDNIEHVFKVAHYRNNACVEDNEVLSFEDIKYICEMGEGLILPVDVKDINVCTLECLEKIKGNLLYLLTDKPDIKNKKFIKPCIYEIEKEIYMYR